MFPERLNKYIIKFSKVVAIMKGFSKGMFTKIVIYDSFNHHIATYQEIQYMGMGQVQNDCLLKRYRSSSYETKPKDVKAYK